MVKKKTTTGDDLGNRVIRDYSNTGGSKKNRGAAPKVNGNEELKKRKPLEIVEEKGYLMIPA